MVVYGALGSSLAYVYHLTWAYRYCRDKAAALRRSPSPSIPTQCLTPHHGTERSRAKLSASGPAASPTLPTDVPF